MSGARVREHLGVLPPDSHVHSEWSWDAPRGSMEKTCAEALRLGLRAVAFTDHVDFTTWADPPDRARGAKRQRGHEGSDHTFSPDLLDVDGYLECLERCRQRFPELRILSGIELGEPHWHEEPSQAILRAGGFERVLISLHSARAPGGEIVQVRDAYREYQPDEVVRNYLADAAAMLEQSTIGAVLAHIDYPVRAWPSAAGVYTPERFEEEIRTVLRALRRSGRALEVNTRLPLDARIVGWWAEERGALVSFGSDAHDPLLVGRGFLEAAAMVESFGFRAGRDPHDLWWR